MDSYFLRTLGCIVDEILHDAWHEWDEADTVASPFADDFSNSTYPPGFRPIKILRTIHNRELGEVFVPVYFHMPRPVIALVNPPLADIAAPHLAGAIDIATTEGISDSDLDGSVYEIRISQDSIPVLLGLAVRDNVDAENSTMNLTIQKVGQMESIVNVSGLVSEIASDGSNGLSPSDTFESVDDEEWVRGLRKNSLTGGYLGPKVAPHSQDISMAWDLCPSGCGPGDYLIQISLTEVNDMVPWQDGENSWQREYTLRILQSS